MYKERPTETKDSQKTQGITKPKIHKEITPTKD